MLEDLVKLANHLDSKGLYKEADALDAIIKEAGIWDSLGFRRTRKRVEPEKSPYDLALDRYNNDLNEKNEKIRIIDTIIRRLNLAGDDITEDNENKIKKEKLVERREELVKERMEIVEKKNKFMENYHYMMIN